MYVEQRDPQDADAALITVHALLEFGQGTRFDRLPASGQYIVQSRGTDDAMNGRFSRRAHDHFGLHLPEQERIRMLHVVMYGGAQFDHVLIAGEHERFVRAAFKAPGAVLHIPLVGSGFGGGSRS